MKSEAEIIEEIIDIGKRIYDRGMVAANDGNISVRLNSHEILCTPTGVSKGFMTREMICKINEKGEVIEAKEPFRPSSEMKMHLRVYEKRPDIFAVVHAHPPYATSFAVQGMALTEPITAEAVISLGSVPLAAYGTPSTGEIPDAIEEHLYDHEAMLLEHHGALTYGFDLTEAYYRMESLEFYADLLFKTRLMGGPRVLDKEKVERLLRMKKAQKENIKDRPDKG